MRTFILSGLWFAAAAVAFGQPAPNVSFSYRTEAAATATALPVNGQMTLTTTAGTPLTAFVVVENRGADAWTISRVNVTGQAFALLATGPQVVAGGAAAVVPVRFAPAAQGTWTEVLAVTVANAAGTSVVTYNFFVRGTGLGAEMVASYFLAAGGNQLLLQSGDRLGFPETGAGQSAAATVVVLNRGTAAGAVRSVGVQGERFRLTGLPLLPATVGAERELRFGIVFEPVGGEAAVGQLSLEYGDGRRLEVALAGRGVAAVFTYTATVEGGAAVRLAPGGTLQLPETAAGATVTVTMMVRNEGSASGRVGTIATTNAVFRLVNLPPLPATLAPGGTVSWQMAFTARESGRSVGRLVVELAEFGLEAVSVAPRLTYAVRVGDAVTPVAEGGTVIFPNVTVGSSNEIGLVVTNGGNAAAQILGLSVSGRGFVVRGAPGMPLALAVGASREFVLRFTPDAVGPLSGTVQIDDRVLPLLGVGLMPGPAPGVQFTGMGGTVNSLEQPAVGLVLERPYEAELTGRLTLSFLPDSFGDDPSIQFATGGRTVEFRVPAGTVEAVFGEGVRAMPLQTGTVAGTITLGVTWLVGAVNVTPSPAPAKSMVVAGGPPVLRNVAVGARSGNTIELLITGLSPLRSVSQLGLQFTAAPGARLETTELSLNVEAAFGAWYQGATARTFGSQFTAAVTIVVQSGQASAVQGVAVTAINGRGSSNRLSVAVR